VSLFDEMLAWGVRPDVVSCTALVTALGTDGQWERAEKVVEWMQRSDIKPNVRTMTALITGERRRRLVACGTRGCPAAAGAQH
jgi:pentatricopeptide repeat protein